MCVRPVQSAFPAASVLSRGALCCRFQPVRGQTADKSRTSHTPSSRIVRGCRDGRCYSVVFGWPTCASVIQTVLRSSSMQYQMRPPAVTSYCHCSSSSPFTVREPRDPFSGCWRLSRCLGSVVIRSHATRALAGAAEQTWSHPLTASLVAYRNSQPPGAGGGDTRSFRFGTGGQASGATTGSPSAAMAVRRRRASRGSAWISAVARHSCRSCATGA